MIPAGNHRRRHPHYGLEISVHPVAQGNCSG
jgi:hypothetical protein